ncbi:MAG: hypothetical protein U5R49_11140 [Deltaproteobacteria bacterium]|nr:hypothetical protein [Deltaproteobacteria bacterium]
MRNLDLYLDGVDRCEGDQKYRINVRFSRTYDQSLTLWYALPATQWDYCALEPMDAFVLAALLKAMEDRATLRVHGPVSASLLDNLEEFQLIFSLWFPDKYARIDIVADHEVEARPVNDRVILSFSGGVDGAFCALNHILRRGPIKRKWFDVNAVLYIEGFDVNIDYDAQCKAVVRRNRALLEKYGDLVFLNVRTNLKYLLSIKRFWASHACVIASVASLFRPLSGGCLIGSSHSYLHLNPWGSHPLTDRLLSSKGFAIHHDMVFTRMEKLKALSEWPEALDNLKVCWEGQYKFDTSPDTNCCVCDKCIRTMLAFKALDQEMPSSFPKPLTPETVRSLEDKPFDWSRLVFLIEIMKTAEQNKKADDPLFKALKAVIGTRRPEAHLKS